MGRFLVLSISPSMSESTKWLKTPAEPVAKKVLISVINSVHVDGIERAAINIVGTVVITTNKTNCWFSSCCNMIQNMFINPEIFSEFFDITDIRSSISINA